MESGALEADGVHAALASGASDHGQGFEATEDVGGVVEKDVVDDGGFEGGAVYFAAGLNHDVEAFALAEEGDDVANVDAAARSVEEADFDAFVFEGAAAVGGGGGGGGDEEVAVG